MATPADLFRWLSDEFSDSTRFRVFCWGFVCMYYVVSLGFMAVRKTDMAFFQKDSWFDRLTSTFWILFATILIWSGAAQAEKGLLTKERLAEFYVLFLFFFSFLYGILNWHWPKKLEGLSENMLEAEVQCFLVSVGAQTTAGYARVKPNHWVTELVAAIQTLLGLAFVVVWVDKIVNKR